MKGILSPLKTNTLLLIFFFLPVMVWLCETILQSDTSLVGVGTFLQSYHSELKIKQWKEVISFH